MARRTTAPATDLRALESALAVLDATQISGVEKGLQDLEIRLGEIAAQNWNILRGELPLPRLVLKADALTHNITLLQEFCDDNGAWLAPHGKTSMAPHLFHRQLAAGGWAMTVANIAQLQVCRNFGVQRIFVANEMVTSYDVQYLSRQLRDHPEVEIYVVIDSQAGLDTLVEALKLHDCGRPQRVLVDFGMPQGRCGVRTVDDAVALAKATHDCAPYVELVGLNGYEGIARGETREERLASVDAYLTRFADAARAILKISTTHHPFLVSAGGSQYFDRVVALAGKDVLPDCQLVLRSGCYVTHDSSFFDTTSPFGDKSWRALPGTSFIPAIEVWSAVLSLPEPGLAILGMGGRDMPTDIELPVPIYHKRHSAKPKALDKGYRIVGSNDQHAYLTYPPDDQLEVGDFFGCGISHPCTAFDKWRVIPIVDDDYNVVDGVRTFF